MVKPVFFQRVSNTTAGLDHFVLFKKSGGWMPQPVTRANHQMIDAKGP